MALDLKLLGDKLRRYRLQLALTPDEVSAATGIPLAEVESYENGLSAPSGDRLLILADLFKADYKFFLSGEQATPFEQTETLYRRYGDDFSKADRRVVQEFLYLADCEAFLEEELEVAKQVFRFKKIGPGSGMDLVRDG